MCIHVCSRKRSNSLNEGCSEGNTGHFWHSKQQQKGRKNINLRVCNHDWGLFMVHACLCHNVETGFRGQAGYQALTVLMVGFFSLFKGL